MRCCDGPDCDRVAPLYERGNGKVYCYDHWQERYGFAPEPESSLYRTTSI